MDHENTTDQALNGIPKTSPITLRQRKAALSRIAAGENDKQDSKDAAAAALSFAPPLRRCTACLRMTISMYACFHCGDYASGDYPAVSKQLEWAFRDQR